MKRAFLNSSNDLNPLTYVQMQLLAKNITSVTRKTLQNMKSQEAKNFHDHVAGKIQDIK